MSQAASKLHALVVNDPSHPAVLNFVAKLADLLRMHASNRSLKTDEAALTCIFSYAEELEKDLLRG